MFGREVRCRIFDAAIADVSASLLDRAAGVTLRLCETRCNERIEACDTERAHCESGLALAHQQLQEAYAEIADLRPKAALPVCSGSKEWIQPVLATGSCYPYACGDTPFACKKQCGSKLDCAPGRSCTAQGRCEAPI